MQNPFIQFFKSTLNQVNLIIIVIIVITMMAMMMTITMCGRVECATGGFAA